MNMHRGGYFSYLPFVFRKTTVSNGFRFLVVGLSRVLAVLSVESIRRTNMAVDASGGGFFVAEQQVHEVFAALDRHGQGSISHADFIRGLKETPWAASILGMPYTVQRSRGCLFGA